MDSRDPDRRDPAGPAHTVLVVEDDLAIRRGLVDALGFAGHDVLESGDGAEGLRIARERVPDLVLLDVMLPGLDGLAVLEALRQELPDLPVILVTARGSEDDRVNGLRQGADDYVVKPFSAREVLARVDAVLRRAPERPSTPRHLRWDAGSADLEARQVTRGAETLPLAEREVALLAYLVRTRGRAVSREELLEHVWGLDPRGLNTRTVDMHVARLRDKLGDPAAAPRLIVTVRGAGYRLQDDVEVAAT